MRGEQGDQAGRFVDDAALETNRGVAGVDAATDTIGCEEPVEFREQQMTGNGFAIECHGFAMLEAKSHRQGTAWPFVARSTPAARAFAGRLPAIDFAARHGQAEQVLVDRVGLLPGADIETALFEVSLFIGTDFLVLFLDFANWRDDLVVAQRFHRQIKAHLVIAHASTTMRDASSAKFLRTRQCRFDNQVSIRDKQRVLPLITLADLHERLDEAAPDRRAAIDRHMTRRTELDGTRLDKRALLVIDTPGIGKHRMHGVTTLPQPGNAEAGVESAGEGKDNVLAFSAGGIRDSGFGIRRS